MARAKKKQAESQGPTFDEVRDDLANWIEAVQTDLTNIVETVNGHAKAGNEISDKVDALSVQVASNRVLLHGAREDIKRERQAGAFGREELLTRIERLDDKLNTEITLMRQRVARIEDVIYAPAEPTLWERVKGFFRGES